MLESQLFEGSLTCVLVSHNMSIFKSKILWMSSFHTSHFQLAKWSNLFSCYRILTIQYQFHFCSHGEMWHWYYKWSPARDYSLITSNTAVSISIETLSCVFRRNDKRYMGKFYIGVLITMLNYTIIIFREMKTQTLNFAQCLYAEDLLPTKSLLMH